MINYTKRYVNTASFLITIFIFLLILKSNLLLSSFEYFNSYDFKIRTISNLVKRNTVFVEIESSNINQETQEEKNHSKLETKETTKDWKIKIPKISLEANIAEGTTKEIMDKYIGHFEETSYKNGNVGLAAHNRGYAVNYFREIKKLKEGDEIFYKYDDFEKTYVVTRNIIITDEDWTNLELTENNTITLITCVENEPAYRRCVQAIEKK